MPRSINKIEEDLENHDNPSKEPRKNIVLFNAKKLLYTLKQIVKGHHYYDSQNNTKMIEILFIPSFKILPPRPPLSHTFQNTFF